LVYFDCSPITHLEYDLPQQDVSRIVETKRRDDVMRFHVNCSGVRYAVIQASSNKEKPDRFVIAYQDEDCLRDLVAAPSILKVGFVSRDEAMATVTGLASEATASKPKPRITTIFHKSHENREFTDEHSPIERRRIPHGIFQLALGMLITLFYSKNLVSVMIRTALGASS